MTDITEDMLDAASEAMAEEIAEAWEPSWRAHFAAIFTAMSACVRAPEVINLTWAEQRVMQDYDRGYLTRLGVAQSLIRAGFRSDVATEKANALPPRHRLGTQNLIQRAETQIDLGRQTGADGAQRSSHNIYVIAGELLAKIKTAPHI
ncbi:hypothetical protein KIKIMORA_00540 [Brevundimonas phage vB_BpoS-Kikimora]|uniref:Uncharacterized protein n=1 Tax=Brevundimonas phage vB_BpoS-Kikimora TaxID=2948601 RepID=A0A9E7MT53_9CAUD|nr:hypothetical protein KIKIMORA_00540 [Brevundimonas phage vB_BpoS-Kikimora]